MKFPHTNAEAPAASLEEICSLGLLKERGHFSPCSRESQCSLLCLLNGSLKSEWICVGGSHLGREIEYSMHQHHWSCPPPNPIHCIATVWRMPYFFQHAVYLPLVPAGKSSHPTSATNSYAVAKLFMILSLQHVLVDHMLHWYTRTFGLWFASWMSQPWSCLKHMPMNSCICHDNSGWLQELARPGTSWALDKSTSEQIGSINLHYHWQ